jgi:hypothetical protein
VAYNCAQEIKENNESHGETTEAAQFWEGHQFAEVVDGGIDPATTLREKNGPPLWCNCVRDRVRSKLELVCWEVLHEQGGQVTIFTKRKEVLLVERVNIVLGVFVDDAVRDNDRSSFVGRPNPEHGETTRKTSNRSKQTLECLGQVMRDVVFIDL